VDRAVAWIRGTVVPWQHVGTWGRWCSLCSLAVAGEDKVDKAELVRGSPEHEQRQRSATAVENSEGGG
jgi:hypothetical protein